MWSSPVSFRSCKLNPVTKFKASPPVWVRLLVCLAIAGVAFAAHQTALDRYVAAPDANYKYDLVNTIPGEGYTAYVLQMTSQQWRTAPDVDNPICKHWVTIVKPPHVTTSLRFLY